MIVQFKNYTCETEWGQYVGGKIALKLMDGDPEGFGEQVATATVNLHDPAPPSNIWDPKKQIWIKNWSENEGMYEALIQAGVITATERQWQAGFCMARLGTLTEASLNELRAQGAPV